MYKKQVVDLFSMLYRIRIDGVNQVTLQDRLPVFKISCCYWQALISLSGLVAATGSALKSLSDFFSTEQVWWGESLVQKCIS